MPKNFLRGGVMLAMCWLWVCSPVLANPGPRYCVDAWGTEEGQLPESSVISMVQTRDGYLWLGTLNGLVRFDGVRFTVFDESNTRGLQSIRIVKLFEDSRSNLWLGTETAGAAVVKNGRVVPIDFGRGRREGHLVGICEDTTGAIWLYTADGDLGRYWNGSVSVWRDHTVDANNPGCGIIADKSGLVWVGNNRGINAIDANQMRNSTNLVYSVSPEPVGKLDFLASSPRGGHWQLANGVIQKWSSRQTLESEWPYPWKQDPSVQNVRAACEDQQGNLIVGTSQGVFWFDASGRFKTITKEDGLSNDSVLTVLPDNHGGLWVGLNGGGLNHVKPQLFKMLEGSAGWTVQSVCQDHEGVLWFSSNDSGVDSWKDGHLTLRYMTLGSMVGPMNFFNARAMLVDNRQRIWACTLKGGLFWLQDGLFKRPPGAEELGPSSSAIHQDRHGLIWVGTTEGLARWDEQQWKTFTTNDGLSANIVKAIADDAQDNLWIGTEQGGLNRLHNGQFNSYRRAGGFPSDNISSIYVDAQQVLWIGTSGSGLIRFHDNQWTNYTVRDGLISDSIDYIIEDGEGCLWIGSNWGLMRVRKKALNDFADGQLNFIPCRKYDRRDGLPHNECTFGSQPAAFASRDGQLWFPTIAGLVSIDPRQVATDFILPPVVIESVRVEEKELNTNGLHGPPPQQVIVPPGEQRLDIQFTSLNLAAPEREHLRYRLQGHETTWTDAPKSRIAHYPKLPPGDYEFEVRACNEDGVFGPTGANLAVIVEPAFWQTGWFRGIFVACLLGLVAAVVHLISTQKLQRQLEGMRQQQALEKERARIARDIHDQVGANLTQLSLLGEMVEADKDCPREAEVHAHQISQTARETTRALDEIVWTVNPSNDTLDGLINYLCKHAQDFLALAGLRYRLEAPAQLPALAISPEARHNVFLAAKEAVTNVVRHAQASEVLIRLRLAADHFALEIEDNGRGPAGMTGKTTRNGLRNMRMRMEDIGGGFVIEPAPKGGTIVRLTVPIAKG